MIPLATVLLMLCLAAAGFAQVPPGDPYDPARHPNPIITYVDTAGFKAAAFQEAQESAGIELLGLSQSDGKRESLSMAEGVSRKVKILGRNVDVTFYAVVRQEYRLGNGSTLIHHSFKNPKLPLPPEMAGFILNQSAFSKPKNSKDARFGTSKPPEQLELRGSPALLFDNDGQLTVFWQEGGASHTVTASIGRKELFRLVEDLL